MTVPDSPSLLLIAVEPGHSIPKYTSMEEIMMEFLHLELENSTHNIWSVGCTLSRENVVDNVLVPSITGNSNKEGETAEDSDDGESILVVAVHVAGTTNKGSRESDYFPYLLDITVVIKSISKSFKHFRPHL